MGPMQQACDRCESHEPCSVTIKRLDKQTGRTTTQSVQLTICKVCVLEIGLKEVQRRLLHEIADSDSGDWWKLGVEAPDWQP